MTGWCKDIEANHYGLFWVPFVASDGK